MRLSFEQIQNHIKQPLKTAYLISGDEPMQLLEAADLLRNTAKQQGFIERETYHIDSKFHWPTLLQQGGTMSLFGDRKILDIRLEKCPLKEGQEYLEQLLTSIDESTLVIISSPKIDKKNQQKKWLQWIMAHGVWLTVWPVEINKLPRWLVNRSKEHKRILTLECAEHLANLVQGNLLAAKQEMDKMFLLIDEGGTINLDLIVEQAVDNARFTPWELLDESCKGHYQRLPQILKRLEQEKVEPMLLARMLQKECLQLEQLAQQLAHGKPLSMVYKEHRIWPVKQTSYNAALKRFGVKGWQRLWVRTITLEKIIIGAEAGDFWDECLDVLFLMAGFSLWSNKTSVNNTAVNESHQVGIVQETKNINHVKNLRQQLANNNKNEQHG